MRYAIQPLGSAHQLGIPTAVDLDKQDFAGEGGEAKVFVQGSFAYKIYHDRTRVPDPYKLRELLPIDSDFVVKPFALLCDHQIPVGTVMMRLPPSLPVARLFTTDFRKRYGITPDMTIALVQRLQEAIGAVHKAQCLVVDANEMNFVVDEKTLVDPYLIDVDSYQTLHFPATAIMASIRDYRATGFSEMTDWFSFGIIACQLWLGLHPFKAKHPQLTPATLEERIRARASIFDRGVVLPPATRDFSLIPESYRTWMQAMFQAGEQVAPPGITPAILLTTPRVVPRSWSITTKSGKTLTITVVGEHMLIDGTQTTVFATTMMVVNNTLYALHHANFAEVRLTEMNGRVIASLGTVWHVLPHATTMLEGLLWQDVMGVPHLMVPTPPGSVRTLPLPIAQGYRLVDGMCRGLLVELILFEQGRYHRLQFHLDKRDYTWQRDVAYQ